MVLEKITNERDICFSARGSFRRPIEMLKISNVD